MKIWAEGKSGVATVRTRLRESGLELTEDEPEVVVVWGGDGSILHTARKYPHSCLLGVREKSIGHLAEIDGRLLDDAIDRLRQHEYRIEEVPRVELSYNNLRIHGMNEVYFCREYEYASLFHVFLEGQPLFKGDIIGDGCLVATPRGSTAYSWTAGRRLILQPHEQNFVFTPLAGAYRYKTIDVDGIAVAKPVEQLRFPSDKELVVKLLRDGRIKFAADGLDMLKTFRYVSKGDELVFRKANETTKFIRLFPSRKSPSL